MRFSYNFVLNLNIFRGSFVLQTCRPKAVPPSLTCARALAHQDHIIVFSFSQVIQDKKSYQQEGGTKQHQKNLHKIRRKIRPSGSKMNCKIRHKSPDNKKPQRGDNANFCLHLWEFWMPHLKYLFHSGRRKRDNRNAIKIESVLTTSMSKKGGLLNFRCSGNE